VITLGQKESDNIKQMITIRLRVLINYLFVGDLRLSQSDHTNRMITLSVTTLSSLLQSSLDCYTSIIQKTESKLIKADPFACKKYGTLIILCHAYGDLVYSTIIKIHLGRENIENNSD
jgi:hypothetical protein